MLCKKPYIRGVLSFGCGQCQPCLFNRRRLWAHRILLESFTHDFNSFVTLTYDQRFCPTVSEKGVTDPTLQFYSSSSEDAIDISNANKSALLSADNGGAGKPLIAGGAQTLVGSHVSKWLKRLRKAIEPKPVRYFVTGEYGEETFRPHYHAALFGFEPCWDPPPAYVQRKKACECPPCALLQKTWPFGFVDSRPLEFESASYIAGYVTKKLNGRGRSKEILGFRAPEKSWKSTRPGIGTGAMDVILEKLYSQYGSKMLVDGDVPQSLNYGKKARPLGRYLRRKLREKMGLVNIGAPEGWELRASEELCALYENYYDSKEYEKTGKHFWEVEKEKRLQMVRNFEGKHKIINSKRNNNEKI